MITTAPDQAALHRAHQLSAALARRAIALLELVPAVPPAVLARLQQSAGVVIAEASPFGPEHVRLHVDAMTPPGLPGITHKLLREVTTHPTARLGRTLADVFTAEEEERDRRLARATALRVGVLRGLLDANRLHRAAIEHVVDSPAVFEVLPVRRGTDFHATLEHVSRNSGFAPVRGGYQILGSHGAPVGRLVTHDALGVWRSRAELEDPTDENADEIEEMLELILALLWDGSGNDGVDALLDEADTLGLDLDEIGSAGAHDIDPDGLDAELRWRWRRAVHIHPRILARRGEARLLAQREEAEADIRARRERIKRDLEAKRRAVREANRRAAEIERRNMYLDRNHQQGNYSAGKGDPGFELG